MPSTTRYLRIFIGLAALACCGALMVFATAFLYISPKLPSIEALKDTQLQTPLRIYSADGKLLGEFGEKRRSPISIQEVPELFIDAFLAAEDDHFYTHHGVDISGLLRAASQLVTSGSIQSGGSTITMQVAKNYFLTQERTFTRKFTEIFLAIEIERALSKGDILELYLNKIFLGNHAYGIEAAAQVYYGKPIRELNLAQMAMIAGLPKAPSAYNPVANPSRARVRRNWILGRMLSLGYISDADYQAAMLEPISAKAYGTQLDVDAPYVSEMVRLDMLARFGRNAYEDGYTVITTVKADLQEVANKALLDGVMEYDTRHGYRGAERHWTIPAELSSEDTQDFSQKLEEIGRIGIWHPALVLNVKEKSITILLAGELQTTLEWEHGLAKTVRYISEDRVSYAAETASELVKTGDVIRVKMSDSTPRHWELSQLPKVQSALVSLDADSGAILSLVGGYNYQKSAFNRVTQAARQPGSNFKPFIYTAALDNGFTPATIINDAPIVFDSDAQGNTWRPSNDNGRFNGPMRLRKALYLSRNLVSIRVLRELGISKAINYVGRFGFDPTKLPHDLSLALGSHSLTPLDIVTGYAVFANGGYKISPYFIDRIIDRDGNTVYRADPEIVCRQCDDEDDNAVKNIEADTLDDIISGDSGALQSRSAKRVLDEEVAFLIDSILKDVVTRGTGRKALVLERGDAAGKTGTTNGPTDAWFSGYSGGIVTATWAGFDQNLNLGRREYGGSVALPIWIDYMREAVKGRPERHLKQPDSVISVRIDPDTGSLAHPGQANAIFEYFRADSAPTEDFDQPASPYGPDSDDPIEIF
ncbi:penicillin-binding protein 1A [uncultured Zhongshania sp.]|uniref:penicillin-binding protein 1A n=1 Tax=uncultured Zhongshania sp. TaxID=1642288 RepID=UPI0025FD2862|nr:penicillin-binding protein 1A [uncultured Zhongshania sp.]|tara:strand:+ start:1369 stop:3822 length:2454 start_codon:yes stop_codon:yes gene_type:complete